MYDVSSASAFMHNTETAMQRTRDALAGRWWFLHYKAQKRLRAQLRRIFERVGSRAASRKWKYGKNQSWAPAKTKLTALNTASLPSSITDGRSQCQESAVTRATELMRAKNFWNAEWGPRETGGSQGLRTIWNKIIWYPRPCVIVASFRLAIFFGHFGEPPSPPSPSVPSPYRSPSHIRGVGTAPTPTPSVNFGIVSKWTAPPREDAWRLPRPSRPRYHWIHSHFCSLPTTAKHSH